MLDVDKQDLPASGGTGSISNIVRKDLIGPPSRSADAEFIRLYEAHRMALAREEPNVSAAMEYAFEAGRLVEENLDAIPHHRANEVGNLAFDAERYGYILFADAMFRLALQLNPEHPNNMQGYVSFIADAELRDKYEDARKYLAILEREFPDFKPERRLFLRTQMEWLSGQGSSQSEQQIEELLDQLKQSD